MKSVKGKLKDSVVIVTQNYSHLLQKGYGEKRQGYLELSLVEALYLVERGWLNLSMSFEELLELLKEGEYLQYLVYRDLRERGYVVKTGFKFGAHFRVYERGEYQKGGHSSYIVVAVHQDASFDMPEIARAVRLAHSVKKTLIIAVVDAEGDVTYYKVERFTP